MKEFPKVQTLKGPTGKMKDVQPSVLLSFLLYLHLQPDEVSMLFAAPRLSKLSTVLLIPSTGLLIAYLWALFRRPAWPDELKRRDRE